MYRLTIKWNDPLLGAQMQEQEYKYKFKAKYFAFCYRVFNGFETNIEKV